MTGSRGFGAGLLLSTSSDFIGAGGNQRSLSLNLSPTGNWILFDSSNHTPNTLNKLQESVMSIESSGSASSTLSNVPGLTAGGTSTTGASSGGCRTRSRANGGSLTRQSGKQTSAAAQPPPSHSPSESRSPPLWHGWTMRPLVPSKQHLGPAIHYPSPSPNQLFWRLASTAEQHGWQTRLFAISSCFLTFLALLHRRTEIRVGHCRNSRRTCYTAPKRFNPRCHHQTRARCPEGVPHYPPYRTKAITALHS